jgi:hypothetical protein
MIDDFTILLSTLLCVYVIWRARQLDRYPSPYSRIADNAIYGSKTEERVGDTSATSLPGSPESNSHFPSEHIWEPSWEGGTDSDTDKSAWGSSLL